jgi:hypothetical protein
MRDLNSGLSSQQGGFSAIAAPLLHEIVSVTEAPRFYDRLRDAPHTLLGTVFDWQTR